MTTATRSEKVRLGIFVAALATTLFLALILIFGRHFWNEKDHYFIEYTDSVAGLERGAAVKMRGVRVGQVESISIRDNVEIVRVDISLDQNTLVKQDTEAKVAPIGITGLQFIELTASTQSSANLAPNRSDSKIAAGANMIQNLSGKAETIAFKVDALLDRLIGWSDQDSHDRFQHLIGSVDTLAQSFAKIGDSGNALIPTILKHVDHTMRSVERLTQDGRDITSYAKPELKRTLSTITNAASKMSKTIDELKIGELNQATRALRTTLEGPALTGALDSVSSGTASIANVATRLDSIVTERDQQLARVLSLLETTVENLKYFSQSIKERPSLLLRGETLHQRKVD